MATTKELQGINLLTKSQYDSATKSDNQVYAIQGQFVIETYVNGTSWYRVYSDSFHEEGGLNDSGTNNGDKLPEISLLKPYSNTNYNLQLTALLSYNTYPNVRILNQYVNRFILCVYCTQYTYYISFGY